MKLKEMLAEELFIQYQQTPATKKTFIEVYLAGFDKGVELVAERFQWVEAGNVYQDMLYVGEEEVK